MKHCFTHFRRVLALVTFLAGSTFTASAQNGGVGIGTTTPNGQFEVATPGTITATDQQSTSGNASTQATSYWQSFTAGSSGQLVQLAVYGGAGNNSGAVAASALLEVFAGTGTGGLALASQTFFLAGYVDNNTPTAVNFASPGPVVAGQVYTFRVSLVNPGPGVYGLASVCTNNCYGGGSFSANAGFDANFQTVVGTPAGVQTRLLVKDGNVGIGTAAPAATLHVGGSASTVRFDGLAGTGSRVVALTSDGSLASAPMPTDAQTLRLSGNELSISGSNSRVTLPNGIGSATNGLTLAGNAVFLGGSLTQATTISQGNNSLGFDGPAGVGIGTAAPAASAQLEVATTTKGFLPPRLTTTQRDVLSAPAVGLMLYNSDSRKLEVWNGTSWTETLTTTEQLYQGPARTFAYTGGVQPYTVPAGVTTLTIDAYGAQGGEVSTLGGGGPGARVQTTLAVTPGEVLSVLVGGVGFPPFSGAGGGGYNGGGGGNQSSGGGGGATDIRRGAATLNDRLVVAAGGGGAGSCTGGVSYAGGGGGAPNGGNGNASPDYNHPGQGATQTAGGAGAFGSAGGSFGQGGNGYASGGGGGYYGGGGGTCSGAGGGSSWVLPAGTSATTMTAALRSGNGQLTLTPGSSRPAPVLDGANFVNLPNTTTASNGLTKTGNNIALGGTLSQATTLAQGGNNFNLTGGNVGIGTSTPNAPLQLANTLANRKLVLYETMNNDHEFLGFGINSNTLRYQVANATDNHVFYRGNGAAASTELMRISGNGNVGIGTAGPASTLDVRTANSAARITVGTTANTGGGITFGNTAHGIQRGYPTLNADNNVGFYTTAGNLYLATNGSSINQFVLDNAGNVAIGNTNSAGYKLFVNGQAAATGGFFNVSDQRLKTNVRSIAGALALVQALNGRRYLWNAQGVARGGEAGKEQVGVLAQELEQVMPELVHTSPDGFKAVNYAQLTPVLIEAIKEQQAQIELLKAQNATLQGQAGTDHASLITLQQQMARLLGESAPAGAQARK